MFKYLNLSRILGKIIEEGLQLKNALYHSKSLKKNDIPAAYSLLSLIVNNYQQLEEAQEEIVVKSKLAINNKYLLIVMMAEYINKGKIIGGGKVKKAILDNLTLVPKINKESKINKLKVQIRLRQNQEGFQKMKDIMRGKGEKDKSIPNLYNLPYQVYSELTKDQTINILESDTFVVQSYSSCLPAFLLLSGVKEKWTSKKYDVIDACSAPGNKTIQLAEYLGENGKVFAFQKNEKRFHLLKNTLKKYKVFNVKPKNIDFLQVNPSSNFKKVKFVLLDPSCSGSGMLTNFSRDSITNHTMNSLQLFQEFCERKYEQLSENQKERVKKLHDFQFNLLNHAASFKPIRLSYSTCSIYKKENEEVVFKFLKENQDYKLKNINVDNPSIHKGFGKVCSKCLRVDPRKMETDGFFVAIFCRKKSEK